ncbi:putative defense protein Hdd11-like [Babylonia areolata]|uniref:putative defense protein Hdd11-like n=1 Tax=Babylonia areolata TaxID=304850 RepID=UPI003FD5683B
MRELLCVVMVAIVGVVGVVSGYPQGAPLSACTDMFPTGHHVDAKAIPAPFTLTVSTTTIAAGQTVTRSRKSFSDQ